MKLSVIYLAAGSSRRMGRPKLSLQLADGVSLGGLALRALFDNRLAQIERIHIVVRPGDDLGWLMPALAENKLVNKVVCPDASSGMSYSLRSGLQAAEEDRPDALLVMLADQPFVDAAHISRLIRAYEEADDLDYAASKGSDEALMPPALLGRRLFAELKLLQGDAGARKLFQLARYRGVTVAATQPDQLLDVDDEEGWLAASERFVERQQQG